MKSVLLTTGAMVVLIVAVGQAAWGDEDSDETRIRGTWQLVSKSHKGVETKIDGTGDDAPDDQMIFTFEEQSLNVKFGPKRALIEKTGTYSLDPKQTPKLLDITIREDKDYIDAHAIYKIEQDRLYIRLREKNFVQRPPAFEIADDDCTTLVFEQVK